MSDKFKSRGKWRTKLEKNQEPELVDVPDAWRRRYGDVKMLIPTPLLIDALARKVPEGKLVTVEQMRERLAADFHVGATCPLTTGIFLRIVAETAEEDRLDGRNNVTPYWRVVRSDGGLNEKFPGGVEAQSRRLADEGHTIEPGKGRKPPRVKDFETSLVAL